MNQEQKYQCTKSRCKWVGTVAEKLTLREDEYLSTLVCPLCGNHEFFLVKPSKPKSQANQKCHCTTALAKDRCAHQRAGACWRMEDEAEKQVKDRAALRNETDVLRQVKKANRMRCAQFGKGNIHDWTPPEWGNAVAGEVGEMCNLIKKQFRGDRYDRDGVTEINAELIGKEAADVVIYLDMLCQRLGIDLSTAIVNKFNETSEKIGSEVTIYYY